MAGADAVDGAAGSEDGSGEVEATELVTISRPAVAGTLAEVGLTLAEAKALLAGLQASMVRDQLAGYAAHHRLCPGCGVPRPLKDRRTRRLQTLFGTLEVEAPRFRVCRCRSAAAPVSEAVSSGSGKNLGHYAPSWVACCPRPKRPSTPAALTWRPR